MNTKKIINNQPTLTANDVLELKRSVYKSSYYEFFKACFQEHNTDEELEDNWHVKELCVLLQNEALRVKNYEKWTHDIIINIPPRHLKTLIANTYFTCWVWTFFPSAKFIVVSYSPDVANEEAERCRNIITSEWYQQLFPHVKLTDDANKKENFKNTLKGIRKSVGAGNAVTAFGAHFIICDDIQNPKRAASTIERQEVVTFYTKTLFNRVNNPSKGHIRINIQQRLHQEDLTGYLLESRPDKHLHICLPSELTEATTATYRHFYKNGLLFPERFDLEALENIKSGQGGAKEYANQYLQQPAPDDGDVFQKDWFTIIDKEKAEEKTYYSRLEFFIDTAEGDTHKHDASAIITAATVGNYIYILDAVEYRLKPADLQNKIVEHVGKWTHGRFNGKVWIEKKSTGAGVIDNLDRFTPIKPQILLPSTRESKLERNKKATYFCSEKRVLLAKGSWNEKLIDQLTMYPNAKHDDLVDAFCYAVNNYKVFKTSYHRIR